MFNLMPRCANACSKRLVQAGMVESPTICCIVRMLTGMHGTTCMLAGFGMRTCCIEWVQHSDEMHQLASRSAVGSVLMHLLLLQLIVPDHGPHAVQEVSSIAHRFQIRAGRISTRLQCMKGSANSDHESDHDRWPAHARCFCKSRLSSRYCG